MVRVSHYQPLSRLFQAFGFLDRLFQNWRNSTLTGFQTRFYKVASTVALPIPHLAGARQGLGGRVQPEVFALLGELGGILVFYPRFFFFGHIDTASTAFSRSLCES